MTAREVRRNENLRLTMIIDAITHLRRARDLLHHSKAPRAAAKVRLALKSAEGAERHARNDEARAKRHAEKRVPA